MSAKTNHAENLLLDWLLTTGSATRPTAWYVGLHTADPGEDAATGEVSGNGYTREAATFTVTGDQAENAAEIVFGPASGSWGTITHFSIWDAVTAGNPLYKGALTASRAISTDDTLTFAAGALTIAEA